MIPIKELIDALRNVAQWLEWEHESLSGFHDYAQKFGCEPGDNVFAFVLKDALRYRDMAQLRKASEVSE